MDIAKWQTRVHDLAVEKGWYDQDREPLGLICLIHSELSEAVEAFRDANPLNVVYHIGDKPEGFAVEIADAVIRILDMCEFLGIDLERAMEAKHQYNMTRSNRHGGKLA